MVIDSRFPLADLGAAWERSGQAAGKIIVDVGAPRGAGGPARADAGPLATAGAMTHHPPVISTDRHTSGADEREALEARLSEVKREVAVLEARRQAAEEPVRAREAGRIADLQQSNAGLDGAIAALALERRDHEERARQLRARALSAGWTRAGLVFGWTVGLGAAGQLVLHAHPMQAALSLAALLAATVWRR